MKLSRLIAEVPGARLQGDGEVEVTGLAADSRRVKPGDLFLAVKGARVDGAGFVPQALELGAVAVAGSRAWSPRPTTPLVTLADDERGAAALARAFHRRPDEALTLVGVTGTNGKTTTAFLVKHLLQSAGRRCGLIGTVRYEIGDRVLPAPHTTPMAGEFFGLLRQMADAGCDSASLEVSSHALHQHRVEGMNVDVAIFTNLTRDHLDYHATMEAYFEAKRRLFTEFKSKTGPVAAVLNLENEAGLRLFHDPEVAGPKLGVGSADGADLRWVLHGWTERGADVTFEHGGRSARGVFPFFGRYNVENLAGVIGAGLVLGMDLAFAVESLQAAPAVPGRLEPVPNGRGVAIFVDYAHTDDALEKALSTLRELPHERLLVVFGCGGDRDRTKRPLMGAVAERLADRVFLTSDNPRTEDPERILADVMAGIRDRDKVEVNPDRRAAIRSAVRFARRGDVLLIAGKGHETYQEIAGVRHPMDDREEAAKAAGAS